MKVDGSFRFIQGTLFRSLRIAALRVLSLPWFLEVFQCSKMRDVKTKEVKSAHVWMLMDSCCQPYRNLPIRIFINHPDACLCWFCSSSFFYLCGFFPTGQLPQVLQKLQTALKVHSQKGSDCVENLQEKLHSGNVHKPVWG